jgi:hypothetical protein
MMLPSGIATLVCSPLAAHPASGNCVHVAPLSVDRHMSFFQVPSKPPIRMMLSSGITMLL